MAKRSFLKSLLSDPQKEIKLSSVKNKSSPSTKLNRTCEKHSFCSLEYEMDKGENTETVEGNGNEKKLEITAESLDDWICQSLNRNLHSIMDPYKKYRIPTKLYDEIRNRYKDMRVLEKKMRIHKTEYYFQPDFVRKSVKLDKTEPLVGKRSISYSPTRNSIIKQSVSSLMTSARKIRRAEAELFDHRLLEPKYIPGTPLRVIENRKWTKLKIKMKFINPKSKTNSLIIDNDFRNSTMTSDPNKSFMGSINSFKGDACVSSTKKISVFRPDPIAIKAKEILKEKKEEILKNPKNLGEFVREHSKKLKEDIKTLIEDGKSYINEVDRKLAQQENKMLQEFLTNKAHNTEKPRGHFNESEPQVSKGLKFRSSYSANRSPKAQTKNIEALNRSFYVAGKYQKRVSHSKSKSINQSEVIKGSLINDFQVELLGEKGDESFKKMVQEKQEKERKQQNIKAKENESALQKEINRLIQVTLFKESMMKLNEKVGIIESPLCLPLNSGEIIANSNTKNLYESVTLFLKGKKYWEAIRSLLEHLKTKEKCPEVIYLICCIFQRMNEWKLSQEWLELATHFGSQFREEVLYTRVLVAFKTADYTECEKTLQELKDIMNLNLPRNSYLSALVARATSNYDLAQREYQKFKLETQEKRINRGGEIGNAILSFWILNRTAQPPYLNKELLMKKQLIKLNYETSLIEEPDDEEFPQATNNYFYHDKSDLRESRFKERIQNLKKIKIFSGFSEEYIAKELAKRKTITLKKNDIFFAKKKEVYVVLIGKLTSWSHIQGLIDPQIVQSYVTGDIINYGIEEHYNSSLNMEIWIEAVARRTQIICFDQTDFDVIWEKHFSVDLHCEYSFLYGVKVFNHLSVNSLSKLILEGFKKVVFNQGELIFSDLTSYYTKRNIQYKRQKLEEEKIERKLKDLRRKIIDWKLSKEYSRANDELESKVLKESGKKSCLVDALPKPEFKTEGLYIVLEGLCILEDSAFEFPQEIEYFLLKLYILQKLSQLKVNFNARSSLLNDLKYIHTRKMSEEFSDNDTTHSMSDEEQNEIREVQQPPIVNKPQPTVYSQIETITNEEFEMQIEERQLDEISNDINFCTNTTTQH